MSDGRTSEPASEPSAQSEQAGGRRFNAHNVIAVYESVTEAREALTHLERKGVEAGNIELLGPGMDGADAPTTNVEQRDADMAVTGQVVKRSFTGIAIGAVIGAVIGILAALAADAAVDIADSVGPVVLAGALGGALFGAIAGAFYGGATGLPVSDAWSETFEAVKGGQTAVSVHADDAGQVDKAIDALRRTKTVRLGRFGADGKVTAV